MSEQMQGTGQTAADRTNEQAPNNTVNQPADQTVAQATQPAVKITVRPNGPFRVEGPISLVDVNGVEWDLTGKPAISLCRCGLSSKRPFCDGTHGREGWQCGTTAPSAESAAAPAQPPAQA